MESDEIRSYKGLDVWRVSMDLAEHCYRATREFPRDEIYGLTSQIRRSAASIPANIAEGYGRESTGSLIQFLRIARGSLKELETHIVLAERVEALKPAGSADLQAEADRIGRILRNFIRSLQAKSRES